MSKEATRTALVTGASRGLGFAIAETLGHAGWQVIAVARTVGGLEELDDRIREGGGPQPTLAPMDIANDDAMRTLCRGIYDRWGRLDLWVHAAIHPAPLGPTATVDIRDWEKSLSVNLRATGLLIPFVAPLLGTEGTVLFLDDSRAGEKFFGAYGATKAGQIALARSWQAETVRTGPRVLVETANPMPTATRARFFPGEDRTRLTSTTDEATRLLSAANLIGGR